jgi:hypothetical protein
LLRADQCWPAGAEHCIISIISYLIMTSLLVLNEITNKGLKQIFISCFWCSDPLGKIFVPLLYVNYFLSFGFSSFMFRYQPARTFRGRGGSHQRQFLNWLDSIE